MKETTVPVQGYDIITIGSGIAASALAKAMAEHGAKVLVLEREVKFKDRVRGEGLVCWCGFDREKATHGNDREASP
jgi:choline dehydrogenase-like flavoprotein